MVDRSRHRLGGNHLTTGTIGADVSQKGYAVSHGLAHAFADCHESLLGGFTQAMLNNLGDPVCKSGGRGDWPWKTCEIEMGVSIDQAGDEY